VLEAKQGGPPKNSKCYHLSSQDAPREAHAPPKRSSDELYSLGSNRRRARILAV
jgi:hypothetical protein